MHIVITSLKSGFETDEAEDGYFIYIIISPIESCS